MTEAPKRGRKPRVKTDVPVVATADHYHSEVTGRITVVGRAPVPDPVPGDNGKALARIVAFFKATHPDEWEQIRLHPLQHGLDDMVALL